MTFGRVAEALPRAISWPKLVLLAAMRLASSNGYCVESLVDQHRKSHGYCIQRHGNAQQGQQLLFAPLAIPGACGQRLRRHHAFPGHACG